MGCRIELFGVPSVLAGRRAVPLALHGPATVADALEALADSCPSLVGPVVRRDRRSLTAGYTLCRGGREFLRDLGAAVEPDDSLLLFATAAGGC